MFVTRLAAATSGRISLVGACNGLPGSVGMGSLARYMSLCALAVLMVALDAGS